MQQLHVALALLARVFCARRLISVAMEFAWLMALAVQSTAHQDWWNVEESACQATRQILVVWVQQVMVSSASRQPSVAMEFAWLMALVVQSIAHQDWWNVEEGACQAMRRILVV